jgi:hypothetical protein
MPTQYRFDDLDLREEPLPARTRGDADAGTLGGNTCESYHCTVTQGCTETCCTFNC